MPDAPITKRKRPASVKLPPAKERRLDTPTPLQIWADDDIRRAALVEVLQTPIMRDALETLRSAYEADIPPFVSGKGGVTNIPPAADLNNLLALRAAHRAGFLGAFLALENLTREKVLRRSNMNPWGDLQPD